MFSAAVGGKYNLMNELGSGGYASVYSAMNISTSALVAIKKINTTPKTTAMIFQEVSISLKPELKSPNIAEMIEAIPGIGCVYLVMKLYEYGDLRKLINTFQFHHMKIPEEHVKGYGKQILTGLSVLQKNGVIHRDLKPENLMFKEDGTICIIDFGIAKNFSSEAGPSQSTLKGTLGYAAPEQIEQEDNLTPACDIFAVGVILYELISGQTPFSTLSLFNFPKAVRERNFKPLPPSLFPGLKDMIEVIEKMLSYNPLERPTAKELLSHPCFSPSSSLLDKYEDSRKENEGLKSKVEIVESNMLKMKNEIEQLRGEKQNMKKKLEEVESMMLQVKSQIQTPISSPPSSSSPQPIQSINNQNQCKFPPLHSLPQSLPTLSQSLMPPTTTPSSSSSSSSNANKDKEEKSLEEIVSFSFVPGPWKSNLNLVKMISPTKIEVSSECIVLVNPIINAPKTKPKGEGKDMDKDMCMGEINEIEIEGWRCDMKINRNKEGFFTGVGICDMSMREKEKKNLVMLGAHSDSCGYEGYGSIRCRGKEEEEINDNWEEGPHELGMEVVMWCDERKEERRLFFFLDGKRQKGCIGGFPSPIQFGVSNNQQFSAELICVKKIDVSKMNKEIEEGGEVIMWR